MAITIEEQGEIIVGLEKRLLDGLVPKINASLQPYKEGETDVLKSQVKYLKEELERYRELINLLQSSFLGSRMLRKIIIKQAEIKNAEIENNKQKGNH